jgi:hypothetical protein
MTETERTQSYRTRTKQRIIASLGGKCVCCGYNRCYRALHVHHLTPDTKTIPMSAQVHISWKKRVIELRDCVLLCSNCHMEYHDGLRDIPLDAARFDEAYAPVKRTPTYCPKCGVAVWNQKYCSKSCATSANWNLDWTKIIERYRILRNYEAVGKEFDCTGKAISKHIKKFGVVV